MSMARPIAWLLGLGTLAWLLAGDLHAQDEGADEDVSAETAVEAEPEATADVSVEEAAPPPAAEPTPPVARRTFTGHTGILQRAPAAEPEPAPEPAPTPVAPPTLSPAPPEPVIARPAPTPVTPIVVPAVPAARADPEPTPPLNDKTIITSDGGFEVFSSPEQNRFVFYDNVEIRAGDFYARCEKMEVISNRKVRDEDAAVGQIGTIESIVATGDVRITQAGREATCQRAEIYPEKGLAYLKEDPVVLDGDTRITGYEMILDRNTETVRILPRPEGGGAGVEIPEAVTTGALPGADAVPDGVDLGGTEAPPASP